MTTEQVEAYYEANTKGFLRFGQGGNVGAIHRAVWGPGVRTRTEAFRYAEDRIAGHMPTETRRVLDLGCGVGASLAYLAGQRSFQGIGVTLSRLQVRMATERFEQDGLSGRLSCERADFTKLPPSVHDVDFAYGIESFALGPDAEAFFAEVQRVLRPGGVLALIDDFAAPRVEREELSFRESRWIREYKRGWHADSLVSDRRAETLAEQAGFEAVANVDLTDHLELGRPRDRLITAMVRTGRHLPLSHPWWLNLLGGNGLQMALTRRLITYRMLVWTRR